MNYVINENMSNLILRESDSAELPNFRFVLELARKRVGYWTRVKVMVDISGGDFLSEEEF